MKITPIFTRTLQSLREGRRRIIHQGGQYSGKTVNILGALATLCSEETDGGFTTVTSMSMPHLKGGALRDFEMYVYPSFKGAIKQYHKTDHLFTFKSGSLLEFRVFENAMAAHGHKRKRLFVNEANKMDHPLFFQMDSRSDNTVLDYNPSIRFWAHTELQGQPGNEFMYSDHRHNPFLSAEKHAEIESICQFAYDEKGNLRFDEKGSPVVLRGSYELWKVYARGITGNVQGVIFPNWEVIDDADFPDEDATFSVDFGYTNDPTAIIKQVKIGRRLFVKELAYETGMAPIKIKETLLKNGFDVNRSPFYCEHDPDMIKAIRKQGILTAMPARKGQGSINAGIELLNTFDVCYTSSSRNIHKERGLYIWITDEKTGKLTNIPIDSNNHTFDAIRYGAYSRYLKAA